MPFVLGWSEWSSWGWRDEMLLKQREVAAGHGVCAPAVWDPVRSPWIDLQPTDLSWVFCWPKMPADRWRNTDCSSVFGWVLVVNQRASNTFFWSIWCWQYFFGGTSPSHRAGGGHGLLLAGYHKASPSGTGPRELFPPSGGSLQLEMRL